MNRMFGPPTDSNPMYLTKCIHNSLLFVKGITPVYSHLLCAVTHEQHENYLLSKISHLVSSWCSYATIILRSPLADTMSLKQVRM